MLNSRWEGSRHGSLRKKYTHLSQINETGRTIQCSGTVENVISSQRPRASNIHFESQDSYGLLFVIHFLEEVICDAQGLVAL